MATKTATKRKLAIPKKKAKAKAKAKAKPAVKKLSLEEFLDATQILTKDKTKAAKTKAGKKDVKHFELRTDHDGSRHIVVKTDDLTSFLQRCISDDSLYDDEPVIPYEAVVAQYQSMISQSRARGNPAHARELIALVRADQAAALAQLDKMLQSGVISFGVIHHVFAVGTEVTVVDDKYIFGATITQSMIEHSMFGPYLSIQYQYLDTDGKEFKHISGRTSIRYFAGVRPIKSFDIRPITDDEKVMLSTRGDKFSKLAIGSHYYSMAGHMEVKAWWSWKEMRATGRCMIDKQSYRLFKENDDYFDDRDDAIAMTSIPASDYWRCAPYLFGFSFVTKQWGRFGVDTVDPIQFKDNAFDQLVLDPEKKKLVKSLVTDSSSGFQDIISGKGGGCIFLLHGDPGVGKTLTAEAIAELLHRPLYSVSVGELGTNTETLEKNLRQILDVAQVWNAVILIDEADIFLEKRTSGDILRNAMVGIFLRLLEYHQGVMFLTTNRVKDFDEAFHSRISIALRYNKLDVVARESIWTNLLAAAGINGLNAAELAKVDINGRQIKNTIRLAQGLARQEGVEVTNEHINKTVGVAQQFQKELKD